MYLSAPKFYACKLGLPPFRHFQEDNTIWKQVRQCAIREIPSRLDNRSPKCTVFPARNTILPSFRDQQAAITDSTCFTLGWPQQAITCRTRAGAAAAVCGIPNSSHHISIVHGEMIFADFHSSLQGSQRSGMFKQQRRLNLLARPAQLICSPRAAGFFSHGQTTR